MLATCGYNKRAMKCKAASAGVNANRSGPGWWLAEGRALNRRVPRVRPRSSAQRSSGRGCRPGAAASAPALRLRAGDDGLGQALALEATAGKLGVGPWGQRLETGGGRVRFLEDGEQAVEPIEVASKGMQSGDDTMEGAENQQAEHQNPSSSSESIDFCISGIPKQSPL